MSDGTLLFGVPFYTDLGTKVSYWVGPFADFDELNVWWQERYNYRR